MNDICNFMPANKEYSDTTYCHFVYETGLKKLNMPLFHSYYRMHLAIKGSGKLIQHKSEHPIYPGCVFFTFPEAQYTLKGDNSFAYMYISFSTNTAQALLENSGVNKSTCVFYGMEHLLDMWITSVRRITPNNAIMLTESVFMHTMSYISDTTFSAGGIKADRFKQIVEYINIRYCDPSLSLAKIAELFFYNEKYVSRILKERLGIRFSGYLNDLRISKAVEIMNSEKYSVAEIASKCGFSDSCYFSKVFKKAIGVSPSDYMANHF